MMRVLLEVETPLSTTGKCFKPNTYVYLSKIKDEQTSKVRKASQATHLNESFYLIFIDTKTNLKTLQTFKNLKAHLGLLDSQTLAKTKPN
jgi:hypothetical protein